MDEIISHYWKWVGQWYWYITIPIAAIISIVGVISLWRDKSDPKISIAGKIGMSVGCAPIVSALFACISPGLFFLMLPMAILAAVSAILIGIIIRIDRLAQWARGSGQGEIRSGIIQPERQVRFKPPKTLSTSGGALSRLMGRPWRTRPDADHPDRVIDAQPLRDVLTRPKTEDPPLSAVPILTKPPVTALLPPMVSQERVRTYDVGLGSDPGVVPASHAVRQFTNEQVLHLNHRVMQAEIAAIIQRDIASIPGAVVDCEIGGIDIRIWLPDEVVYIEIKTESPARMAIRLGLGQVLEYGFLDSTPVGDRRRRFIIVGQDRCDQVTQGYVNDLNQRFRIPVSYRNYRIGTHAFDWRLLTENSLV